MHPRTGIINPMNWTPDRWPSAAHPRLLGTTSWNHRLVCRRLYESRPTPAYFHLAFLITAFLELRHKCALIRFPCCFWKRFGDLIRFLLHWRNVISDSVVCCVLIDSNRPPFGNRPSWCGRFDLTTTSGNSIIYGSIHRAVVQFLFCCNPGFLLCVCVCVRVFWLLPQFAIVLLRNKFTGNEPLSSTQLGQHNLTSSNGTRC